MTRTWLLSAFAGVLSFLALGFVLHPSGQEGGTWKVDYGDPGHSGEHTTTVGITYEDSEGKQQRETFTAKIDITDPGGTGAVDKKTMIQEKLQEDIDNKKVGGQPLINIGGTGCVLTISPNRSNPSASNIKIKDVGTDDKTKNDDEIDEPANLAIPGLGIIEARGGITGQEGNGASPSYFDVVTSEGVDAIALDGTMTKPELLREIGIRLKARGARVWVDARRQMVFVLLDDDPIGSLGAGSSDTGLIAHCSVRVAE